MEKSISNFLEQFRGDTYVIEMISKDTSITKRYYHFPAFNWSKRKVNQEGSAFSNFWTDRNAALLKYHFERNYGVNSSNKKQMSVVLTALKILFFEIREASQP